MHGLIFIDIGIDPDPVKVGDFIKFFPCPEPLVQGYIPVQDHAIRRRPHLQVRLGLPLIGKFLDLGIGDAEILQVLNRHADLVVGKMSLLVADLFAQLLS